MSRAKSTKPRIAMVMAKFISPIKVVVTRFCPAELQPKVEKIFFLKSSKNGN